MPCCPRVGANSQFLTAPTVLLGNSTGYWGQPVLRGNGSARDPYLVGKFLGPHPHSRKSCAEWPWKQRSSHGEMGTLSFRKDCAGLRWGSCLHLPGPHSRCPPSLCPIFCEVDPWTWNCESYGNKGFTLMGLETKRSLVLSSPGGPLILPHLPVMGRQVGEEPSLPSALAEWLPAQGTWRFSSCPTPAFPFLVCV